MKLQAYLNFGGNCEEALHFYEQHLGGRILMLKTHEGQQHPGAPAGWEKKILHARILIGEMELLASDVPPERYQPMRSVYLSLSVDSTEEAERVGAALAEGGEVFMPMQETFFALRFAMLRDRFGTSWMVIYDQPMDPA